MHVDPMRRAALVRLGLSTLPWPIGLPALAQPQASPPRTRVALVVGNSAYPGAAALRNPKRDAEAMGATLQRLGFTVVQAHDADRAAMRAAVERTSTLLRGRQGVGLLYYAGHGVQVQSRNFMLPVDSNPTREDDVPVQCLDVGDVIDAFRRAGTRLNIVVLDACRDNPFADTQGGKGLAPLDAPPGTFLAYATAPGNVAEDGSAVSGNGLYTGFLLKELQRPGARIEDVFKRVRFGVRQASQGRQVPWESTSLEDEFFFDPETTTPASREAEAIALAEKTTWDRIHRNARPEDLFAFLLVFPAGRHAEQASFLLNRQAAVRVQPVAAPALPGPTPTPVPAPSAVDPAASAAPGPEAPAAATPLLVGYRGERFRVGDTCEWVVRDHTARDTERGRVTVEVRGVDGLDLDLHADRPTAIRRDAMGARRRDAFAAYDEPLVDLPAEYALGVRWRGRTALTLAGGAKAVLDYRARVVGREVVAIGRQRLQTYVVEIAGVAATPAGRPLYDHGSRLWALPNFGIPLRQRLWWRARGASGQPLRDDTIECLWVRLRS